MVKTRSIRARRAAAQLLSGERGLGAEAAVGRLLAIQAQDLRAARLALRPRASRLTAAGVDRVLTEERSLVVAPLLRGTLHLVRAEDYPWLLALTAPTHGAAGRRRLAQEGVPPDDAERAMTAIERALAHEGPLTRAQLAERIAAHGVRTEGQATPHLLMLSALRGVAVLGPVESGRQAFALTSDWLGTRPAIQLASADREAALAELARRYLAGHGPASPADLTAWAGLPLRDARAGLRSIGAELTELNGGLVDLAGRRQAPRRMPPRLLPAFDPYLLGWKDRAFAVPAEHARRVHPGGGVIRAVASVDGRAIGTWRIRRRSGGAAVDIDLFSEIGREASRALRAESEDVARYEAGFSSTSR